MIISSVSGPLLGVCAPLHAVTPYSVVTCGGLIWDHAPGFLILGVITSNNTSGKHHNCRNSFCLCWSERHTWGGGALRMWNVGKGILGIMNGTNIGSKRHEAFQTPVDDCGQIRTWPMQIGTDHKSQPFYLVSQDIGLPNISNRGHQCRHPGL